jgi:hypothetical protein
METHRAKPTLEFNFESTTNNIEDEIRLKETSASERDPYSDAFAKLSGKETRTSLVDSRSHCTYLIMVYK